MNVPTKNVPTLNVPTMNVYSECGPFYLFFTWKIITHTPTLTHTNPNTHTRFCTTTQHPPQKKLNNQSSISIRQVITH